MLSLPTVGHPEGLRDDGAVFVHQRTEHPVFVQRFFIIYIIHFF